LPSLRIYQKLSNTEVRLMKSLQILKKHLTQWKNNSWKSKMVSLTHLWCHHVPQGGHLSPLLFILFVNPVTKWITKTKLLIFADDIQIFLKMYSLNRCHILRSKLDIFANLRHDIDFSLNNRNKCHVVSTSRKQSPIHHNYYFIMTPLFFSFIKVLVLIMLHYWTLTIT